AEQRRDRHVMSAAERPQGEGGGGEQAIKERQRKLAWMQRRRNRQGQHRAEGPGDEKRQGRADGEARQRAEAGEHQHLREINPEHARAGRAQRLERGDDLAGRSRWPLTALATPTPPTSSAVSPTNVRYCVKRSTLRSSDGEALARERTSQPASGN